MAQMSVCMYVHAWIDVAFIQRLLYAAVYFAMIDKDIRIYIHRAAARMIHSTQHNNGMQLLHHSDERSKKKLKTK